MAYRANFGVGYEETGKQWVEEAMGRFVTRCRRFPPQYERLVNLHSVLISREVPDSFPKSYTTLSPLCIAPPIVSPRREL